MTKRDTQIHQIEWSGITIEIRYTPSWSPAYLEVYGHPMAHLVVQSTSPERAELPITKTGYYSLFLPGPSCDAEGGPAEFVRKWIAAEAETKAWKARQEAARQMSLF